MKIHKQRFKKENKIKLSWCGIKDLNENESFTIHWREVNCAECLKSAIFGQVNNGKLIDSVSRNTALSIYHLKKDLNKLK